MADSNSNAGVWRLAASALAGLVVAGVGFWLLLGRDAVTKDEVKVIVEREAPYTRDRDAIAFRLGAIERQAGEFDARQRTALADIAILQDRVRHLQHDVESLKQKLVGKGDPEDVP